MSINRREFTRATLAAGIVSSLSAGTAFAGPGDLVMKTIPSSGEQIPAIGLGTNRYGVDTSQESRAPLLASLERFQQLGGSLIDTAPGYRTSESVLGDLIERLGNRDKFFIATKTDKDEGPAATDAQMRDSQEKLHSEKFELMQVHNLKGWKQALPVMREWRQEGLVRYIGITTSRDSQYAEFEKVMRDEELDFIQVNYSLEQQEAADRILPLAKERGIAVIINRAFGGGRIFDSVGDEPLPAWAAEFDCGSWAQFLLKYAISHPAATVAIPGMTKVHHVEDNMKAAHGRLPDATERAKMETFFADL